jgi:hypothetical protein
MILSSLEVAEKKETSMYKKKRAWHKLINIMDPNLRITDARKAADTLSCSRNVALSADVRHDADQLIGWFEQNWETLAPGLPSCAGLRNRS